MGTDIEISDIPDPALAVMRSRAATEGLSVEKYLRHMVIVAAESPTVAEVLARSSERSSGLSMSDIVAYNDHESLDETDYLMSSSANARKLQAAIDQLEGGDRMLSDAEEE